MPENFIYHYQTLITGILALSSIIGLWFTTKWQIQSAKQMHQYDKENQIAKENLAHKKEVDALRVMLQAEILCNWGDYNSYCESLKGLYLYILGSTTAGQPAFKHSRSIFEASIDRLGILGIDTAGVVIKAYHDIKVLEPSLNSSALQILQNTGLQVDDANQFLEVEPCDDLKRLFEECQKQTTTFKETVEKLAQL